VIDMRAPVRGSLPAHVAARSMRFLELMLDGMMTEAAGPAERSQERYIFETIQNNLECRYAGRVHSGTAS
jgi:hypothetical protein